MGYIYKRVGEGHGFRYEIAELEIEKGLYWNKSKFK